MRTLRFHLLPVPLAASLTLLCMAIVGGCGPGQSDTVPVSGTVTYNAEPLGNVNVRFTPKGAQGRPATAVTDADGRFDSATTFETGDGAIPGEYDVVILPASKPLEELESEESYAGAETGAEEDPNFPSRYMNPKASGFTATVEPGGDNDFNFELKD